MLARSGLFAAAVLSGLAAVTTLAPSAQSGIEPVAYAVDGVHSSVIFRILHNKTAYFYGRFDGVKGSINFDEASPEASSLNVEVQLTSVHTGNPKRDDHLRSPDFFDVSNFPTATFKSRSFRGTGDSFDVAGDLTLHGETKPLTVQLKKTGGNDKLIGFETTFTISRKEFGITYGPENLGDEVRLTISLEAKK
jgi:polyisoprenoid-binding protein YceI